MKLRLERERQTLALSKIAEETRISKRYIEAIEADDLASLPGDFFYRSFVRQYSKYLGWDPNQVEQQINLVSSAPSSDMPDISIAAEPASAIHIATDKTVAALRESLKDKPVRNPQDSGISKMWLAFACVVIVACGGYFAWRNFSPPRETAQAPAPAPQIVQTTPVETPVSKPPQDAPADKPPEPSVTEPSASPPGKFSLVVRAKSVTWIRLTADGEKIYGGTIDAGQERTVNAKDAELIVGNAGTLDVIYNGKPLDYGRKGEVKTLLLSPDGWKFKPKAGEEASPRPPGSSSNRGSTSGNGTAARPSAAAF